MGQEQSGVVDDSVPPQTLSSRSLDAVAELIKDGRIKNIVLMTGAGISTSAGIPDFRSPKTGLYHNLARLNLPQAESVFDISYFRSNPAPFYLLAEELYPGKYHPTISHVFIALLARKGLLKMCFTQNIDTLERAAGVPPKLLVEAHGSFATQRCIECQKEYPDDKMREHVQRASVPRCPCGGLVKPDIVFFGEGLPEAFWTHKLEPARADLVVVMGTSLTVQPFAHLPDVAPEHVPRLLFNLQRVGTLGGRADDVLCLGDCDSGVRRFADALGWRDELERAWRDLVGDDEAANQLRSAEERDAVLEHDVGRLADDLDNQLKLNQHANGAEPQPPPPPPPPPYEDEPHSGASTPKPRDADAEVDGSGNGGLAHCSERDASLDHIFVGRGADTPAPKQENVDPNTESDS